MHRAAIWSVAGLLAAVLIAFAYAVGLTAGDDGGSATTAPPDSQSVGDALQNGGVDFEALDEIVDILLDEYVGRDELDKQELFDAAVDGLLGSLDDTGTYYLDPDTFGTAFDPQGTFEGIGANVSSLDDEIIILGAVPGSPAEAAGLAPGDVVLAVDGESTAGWTVEKAAYTIRGPKGTDVTITIRRQDGTTTDLTITRDTIQLQTVSDIPPGGALLDANGTEVTDIAYVRIGEFTVRTPEEVEPILREAQTSGKRGLILDLRNNPGGVVDATIQIADMFLDGGRILSEVDQDDNETNQDASPGGVALTIPIVIVQNQYSASAAEILAAALKDNGRATIVGEKSYGKGTVNIPRALDGGQAGALFVTVARWLTPSGVLIDGVGILPDIEVALPDAPYQPENDTQLQRAIQHLRSLARAPALAAP